jgi:hypothetical protein
MQAAEGMPIDIVLVVQSLIVLLHRGAAARAHDLPPARPTAARRRAADVPRR